MSAGREDDGTVAAIPGPGDGGETYRQQLNAGLTA